MGRQPGSRNRGYFYRAGRGWFTKIDGSFVALTDPEGERIRSKSTPIAEVKAAYARIIAAPVEPVNSPAEGTTVQDVCNAYLDQAKAEGSGKTYGIRADALFDFCYGFPARFRDKSGDPLGEHALRKADGPPKEPTRKDRIHDGYGRMAVTDLLPLHVDQWLAKHKSWKGAKRTKVQALKRAMNYGVEAGLIALNPIKGFRTIKNNARVTYITPEQEEELCQSASYDLEMAIKVLIRTGARPGCEFAALTAKHVKDQGSRMEWVFQPQESKTKRLRTIRITDIEIIAIVRDQIRRHPTGKLFRSVRGEAWTRRNLSERFRRLRDKLRREGSEFDDDCVLYATRHTYAKRILQGYWSGKQTNIETLARLMGNSVQVCRDHYLQWTDSYNEPLWESA